MSSTAERLTAIWEPPHSVYSWFATVDHKRIGMRYLVVSFFFLLRLNHVSRFPIRESSIGICPTKGV